MKQILLIFLLIYFPVTSSFGVEIPSKTNYASLQVDSLSSSDSLNSNNVTPVLDDTISVIKSFSEVYGYQKGKFLSYNDYRVLFANNPAALEEIEISRSHHRLGTIFTFVGGFMFGFIGVMGLQNIKSVDYTWGVALAGSAAVVGVGFLIYKLGNYNKIKAINIYNEEIDGYSANKDGGYLKIGFTNSGIGLVYNF
jgi:hypothetical protein